MARRTMPRHDTLEQAVALAMHAPSVHNTQPWRWRIAGAGVDLYADPSVALPATDPDRRDLLLSCGIALHHLLAALAAQGYHAKAQRLPKVFDPHHVAHIDIGERCIPTPEDLALEAAIMQRRTDRRRFSARPVPAEYLHEFAGRAARHGVVLHEIPVGVPRARLADAMRAAARHHGEGPDYRLELATWSGLRAAEDGVPSSNAVPPQQGDDEIPSRTFAGGSLRQPAGADGADAASLIVLGTAGDDRLSRLRAGEATSEVLLDATRLGLATCPITEPLEIADIRAALRRDILNDELFPQIVLRVGWSVPGAEHLPQTPRRPV
ncbi:MAG: nitroreductase family protein, partial [Aldersonia sp.]|nr:nitroreductase family protein [Aldersonia sp.]